MTVVADQWPTRSGEQQQSDRWALSGHRARFDTGMLSLILIFVLGIVNFALHRAVLESGHPLLGQATWFFGTRRLRVSLWVEFAVLVGTMLMVEGASGWAWFYAAYSALNAASAWLILSGRV